MTTVYADGLHRETGELNCEFCETTFEPSRCGQRFDSDKCRIKAHYAKGPRRPNPVRDEVLSRDGFRCTNPLCDGQSPRLFVRKVLPGKRLPENCVTVCGRCCALVSHEIFKDRTGMNLGRYWAQCEREKKGDRAFYKRIGAFCRGGNRDDYTGEALAPDG